MKLGRLALAVAAALLLLARPEAARAGHDSVPPVTSVRPDYR